MTAFTYQQNLSEKKYSSSRQHIEGNIDYIISSCRYILLYNRPIKEKKKNTVPTSYIILWPNSNALNYLRKA